METEKKPQIPKIIHQTWKTREIPSDYTKWVTSWQQLNPGWEYRLWTDEDNRNLIKEQYPEHLHMYDSFPKNIMRVDTIRYYLMYTYGGIYVDLDFECLEGMDSLVENQTIIIGHEPEEHVKLEKRNRMLCNAWMASIPKHPFWHAVISEIHRRHTEGSDWVMGMTGPVLLDDVYEKFSKCIFNDIYVPPVETLYPLLGDVFGSKYRTNGQKVYAVHHWKGTWGQYNAIPIVKYYNGFSFYPTLDAPGEDIQLIKNLDESRNIAMRTNEAKGFNTHGWLKHTITDLKKLSFWNIDNGIYIKKYPNGYPTFENYDMYVDQDFPGCDLYRFVTNDIHQLEKIASRDPYVVAFNTEGWFKYKMNNHNNFIPVTDSIWETYKRENKIPNVVFYVKKKIVYPSWARDWDYYPFFDSPGNDNEKIEKLFLKSYTDINQMSSIDMLDEHTLHQILHIYKNDPSIVAINTDGYCKEAILPKNQWIQYPNYRYMGLFVKRESPRVEDSMIQFSEDSIETFSYDTNLYEKINQLYITCLERPIHLNELMHYKKQVYNHGWTIIDIQMEIEKSEEYIQFQERKREINEMEEKIWSYLSSKLYQDKLKRWFNQNNISIQSIHEFYDSFIILDKEKYVELENKCKNV